MNDVEMKLRDELHQLSNIDRYELMVQLNCAIGEEVREGFDRTVSNVLNDALTRLEARIAAINQELDKVADCAGFVAQFGKDVHDFYKKTHPINRHTQLRREPILRGLQTFSYALPPEPLKAYNLDKAPPPYIKLEQHTVDTMVITDGERVWRVAYAPEINTVFWINEFPR